MYQKYEFKKFDFLKPFLRSESVIDKSHKFYHNLIISASGQLFIYYTISQFGAVVFIIIMTTRSALAIILSCIIYGHPVNGLGVFGILVAFSSLAMRIFYKIQQKKKTAPAKPLA
jgi:hypothetical protein